MKSYLKPIVLFIILAFSFGLESCSGDSSKVAPIDFEIHFFEKVVNSDKDKYPSDFSQLIGVINSSCEEGVSYFPTALKFRRCDLNEKVDTDYLGNAKGNKTKIGYLNKQLEYFLRDSTASPLLSKESVVIDVESYIGGLSEKNLFIYSDEDVQDFKGFTVFSDAQTMKDSISKVICDEKLKRIVILYKPKIEKNPPPPGADNSLASIFKELSDTSVDPSERMAKVSDIVAQNFAEGSTIEEFGENGARLETHAVEDYLTALTVYKSIESVEVISSEKNDAGKYWTVRIVEHHKMNK